jgi:uncharacterized membrane protein YdjX (TVP38/TMEM64 family)
MAFILLFVIVIAVLPSVRMAFMTGLYLLATGQLAQFQRHLLSLGAWGPIMSVLLMVAEAVIIPVPVTVLMVSNGLVFGIWRGTEISFVGGLLGALAAYLIGRGLGRSAAERLLPPAALAAADRFMRQHGRWALVIGRWLPGVPCDPISYAAGIMRMPILPFVLLTIAGLLPGNLAAAFVGEKAAEDIRLGYWLLAILLAAGVWIIWRLTRTRASAPPAANR